jgi:hypothetical protein
LGRRDPRLRGNQSGAITDNDLDRATIARDGSGRQRVSAADQLKPLPANATSEQIRLAHNQLVRKLRGQ